MQENGKSKTTLCFELLRYLSDGRVWKISELAAKLKTNPRNIIEYRKDIESAGYIINQRAGKNGGYILDKDEMFPSLKLTEEEKKVLLVAGDYIKSRPGVIDYNLYQQAMSKIFSSIKVIPETEEAFIIPGSSLVMSNDDFHKRFTALKECISKRLKISLDYLSTDNVVRTRVFEPYELFMFNNAWFVIGFCHLVSDIRYFKINRIENFTILYYEKKFIKPRSFDRKKYFDETGFKIGIDWSKQSWDERSAKVEGDWVHIKLELSGKPAMYVKEYKYGENQVVTPVDKDTTILECDMHYKYNTIKFVLGFGLDCKVLEPQWLKEEVVSIAKQMAER